MPFSRDMMGKGKRMEASCSSFSETMRVGGGGGIGFSDDKKVAPLDM